MKTIWKYQLSVTDYQEIKMPAESKILTARAVGHDIFAWAIVPDTEATEEHGMEVTQFAVVGTGHEFPKGPWAYVGTCMIQGGLMNPLFFHVFWR